MFGATLLLLIAVLACFYFGRQVLSSGATVLLIVLKVLAGSVAISYYLYFERNGDLVYYQHQVAAYTEEIRSGQSLWTFLSQTADPAAEATPQNRTFFFLKIITVLGLLLAGNIWMINLFTSLLSFLAVIYFIRRTQLIIPNVAEVSILIFFLWPSVAIWGGGLSKESMMLTAMATMLGAVLPLIDGKLDRWGLHVFLLLATTVVLAKLRFFVLLSMMPVLLGFPLFKLVRDRTRSGYLRWWLGGAAVVVIGLASVGVSFLDTSFNPGYFLRAFVDNHAAIVAQSNQEHLVTGLSALWDWPVVIFQFFYASSAGIFGPFLWELNTIWEVLLVLEPLAVIVLFFSNDKLSRRLPAEVWLSLMLYAICTAGFITLSTPNYGSLSRYRLAFYPVVIFMAGYRHHWLSKISFLSNRRNSAGV